MTQQEWIEEQERAIKIDVAEGDRYSQRGFVRASYDCYESSYKRRVQIREALEVVA